MCTGIYISKQVFGRTLEFSYNIGYFVYKSKNVIGLCNNDEQFLDGLNKYGLCVSIFKFDNVYAENNSENKTETENKIKLSDSDLSKFLLFNAKNVKEVIALLKNITVISDTYINNRLIQMHWSVVDSTGSSIVLELNKNNFLNIYKNTVNVITNNPSFPEHVKSLKSIKNLSTKTFKNSCSTGTGAIGLPGDFSSISRFIRAYFLIKNSKKNLNNVNLAFHILNSFDIPLGTVVDKYNKFEETFYTVVYDLKNFRAYYKTYENQNIVEI